nr:hypothetical protein Iba_scaffold13807CG0010 [Ipomoea batatas]
MTPLSMTDLSKLNIGRTLRLRRRTRTTKKKLPKIPKVEVEPPPPPSSSPSPQPNTPGNQIHTSSEDQRISPPTLSPSNSIFNDSVAPAPKSPTPIPSSSSPAALARFTKVTNWVTMQRFQYELHMEHEALLEQRDARHYKLIEGLSMQVAFLREELARRGPSTGL